jgi:hypothetical protein
MPERDRRILEHIAAELGRLQRQAEAVDGGDLLAYLMHVAITEALDVLRKHVTGQPAE